jgi:hypothetical protein
MYKSLLTQAAFVAIFSLSPAFAVTVSNSAGLIGALGSITSANTPASPYNIDVASDITVSGALPAVSNGSSVISGGTLTKKKINLSGNRFNFLGSYSSLMVTSISDLDIYNAYTGVVSQTLPGGSEIFPNFNAIYSYRQILNLDNVAVRDNNLNINQSGTYTTAFIASGAVYNDGGIANIDNSKFYNNTATIGAVVGGNYLQGGAVTNGSGGILNVNNSTFSGNSISLSSGYSQGGAIFNSRDSTLNIGENNIFAGNWVSAPGYNATGGAIYNIGGYLNIGNGNQFYNNYASGQGGAIATYDSTGYGGSGTGIKGVVNIGNNNEFVGNYVTNSGNNYYGGAIIANYTILTIGDGNLFEGNWINENQGGAIAGYYSSIKIGNNNRFISNKANNTTGNNYGGGGGAVSGGRQTDLSIGNGNKFYNNSIYEAQGGAVASGYEGVVNIGDNNEFIGNYIWGPGTNYQYKTGAAVSITVASGSIGSGNKFDSNIISGGGGQGGAVIFYNWNSNSYFSIGDRNIFTNNSVTTPMNASSSLGNTEGGAIHIGSYSAASPVTIGSGNIFDSNFVAQRSIGGAYATGGAINSYDNLVLGDNNKFTNNGVEKLLEGYNFVGGGAIWLANSSGGYFLQLGDGNVFDGNFVTARYSGTNSGTINGGAINTAYNTNLYIGDNNAFSNNIIDANIYNATINGGAISNQGNLEIGDGAEFIGNKIVFAGTGYIDGGAIAKPGGNSMIIGDNALFKNNSLSVMADGSNTNDIHAQGGAIYMNGGDADIGDNAQFIGNSISAIGYNIYTHGGAIWLSTSGEVNIGDNALFKDTSISATTTMSSGSGYLHGGVLYNAYGAKVSIGDNAKFINTTNKALGSIYVQGGVIFNTYQGSVTIGNNAVFENTLNTANKNTYGGAIANVNGSYNPVVEIGDKARFINNKIMITELIGSYGGQAYGGAIFNTSGGGSGSATVMIGDGAVFSGNKVSAIGSGVNGDVSAHAGAVWNSQSGTVMNFGERIVFENNSAEANVLSLSNQSLSYGGAIWNDSGTRMYFDGGALFDNNHSKAVGGKSAQGYGGAIFNFNNAYMTFGDKSAFKRNSTQGDVALGGAIAIANGSGMTFDGGFDAINNYARSDYVLEPTPGLPFGQVFGAFGGAIFIGPGANIDVNMSERKQYSLIENNYIANIDDSYRKLNSFHFAGGGSNLVIDAVKGSYINVRDPMTSEGNMGFSTNKNGAGSFYLWGDNSGYLSYVNINGGSFYAMYEENQTAAQKAVDPLAQRAKFSLKNAAGLTFADNTLFRPMMNSAHNKLVDIMDTPNLVVGSGVLLAPYDLSSLAVGRYEFDNPAYSIFSGWESDFAKMVSDPVLTIKRDLEGYKGLTSFADIYRKRTDIGLYNRELLDDFYMTGVMSDELLKLLQEEEEDKPIIGGGDYTNYHQAYRASLRHFDRQIKSRVNNRNRPMYAPAQQYGGIDVYNNIGPQPQPRAYSQAVARPMARDNISRDQWGPCIGAPEKLCYYEQPRPQPKPKQNNFFDHVWVNGYVADTDQDSKGNLIGYKYNSYGFALGYDHDFTPALNLGAAVHYAHGHVRNKTGRVQATGDVDEYMAAVYGKYKPAATYLSGAAGGGRLVNKTIVRSSSVDAEAKRGANAFFVNAELGYDFGLLYPEHKFLFETYVGADWKNISEGAYSERGLGARHFDSMSWNIVDLLAGFRLAKDFDANSMWLTPQIDIAYARNVGDRDVQTTANFVNSTGGSWRVYGLSENPNTIRGTLNLKVNLKGAPIALNFGMGMDFRPDYLDTQYYITFRYDF